MEHNYSEKCAFICEMYDVGADEIVDLILNYYLFDNSFEVINTKKGKKLLARVQIPTITRDMLHIGSTINVYSKLLHIKDCSLATYNTLFKDVERTFAIIKPVSPKKYGKILTHIMKQGFRITKLKNARLSKDFALKMYARILGTNSMMPVIVDYIISGDVVGLELLAPKAIKSFRKCLGHIDPKKAEPGTIRAIFGESMLHNAVHGCKDKAEVDFVSEEFFGFEKGFPKVAYRATLKDCTCCIIKPHALTDGNLGAILEMISTSDLFWITAMAMFSLTYTDVCDFYEVYKGVVPEYHAMCEQLSTDKCLVLEVKCKNPDLNCVNEFRQFCGPRDPDLCRQLYPDSIRARYGRDLVHNAVHCTDLPEDGVLEVEYFFRLLVYKHII